ncbi:MAG: ribonuclease P protein component [Candidatus Gastranaerophilales bacterium]|nr:ribonuclease P protein component [Candidatus Gastranaerophilales bacterium]
MLPKAERLKISSEFTATYNIRKSVSNSLLICYVGREKTIPDFPTRVGFVVSKKISKKASDRNLIKRRMREVYRNMIKSGASFKWRTLIFLARQDSLNADYKEIQRAMEDCLKKAGRKF